MLCQHCKKNEATENSVEIINGTVYESHLCRSCYQELFGHLGGGLWAELFGTSAPKKKSCPVCGTTFADYERTGLLGCASCYDVFKEELLPAIRRIHGKVEHVGKVENNNDEFGLHRRLKGLQEQLETALREKRFSEADILNKRIKEITSEIYGGDKNG